MQSSTLSIDAPSLESRAQYADALQDRLLKPTEVAPLLGVTTGYLANLRSRGEGINYVKVGAAVRYKASDVARFIAAHTVLTAEVAA